MTLDHARATLATHSTALEARHRYEATVKAYHAGKPTPPKGERPAKPTIGLPTAEQVADAQRLRADAERAQGAAEANARALAVAQRDLTAALSALKDATAEAARVVKLVAATRQAPGIEAAKSLSAMGDMEGVEIEFVEERGPRDPYVRVGYRGIPFDLLSGGQKVLVSLLMQIGMRRATGLAALQIVIDNCQDWTGDWPDAGPSIWLWTIGEAT